MDVDWDSLIESGRGIVAASRLAGQDEKFPLGDLALDAGALDDVQLNVFAKGIGYGLSGSKLKSYREVAKAWPPGNRVAASWTAHRTLAKKSDRFDLIQPGMTLRTAQVAAGGRTSDDAHPARWPLERRVTWVISQLQDKELNQSVHDQVEGQKQARTARKAARDVLDETSAAYREARREMRERYNAQGPENAVLRTIFRLRESVELVRAIGRAGIEGDSWLPEHRKPDVVEAVRDLAIMSIDALAGIGIRDRGLTVGALRDIKTKLQVFDRPAVENWSGLVINATTFDDDADAD